jgi:hypothetical protein
VDAQGIVVAHLGNDAAGVLDQRLGEVLESDTVVAVEAPGGLGGGEGAGGAGQGAEPGRDGLQGGQVLLDQLEVSVLEPGLDTDYWMYIQSLYAR